MYCGLFYFYVFELTLFELKILQAQQISIKALGFKSPMEILSSFCPNMRTTNHLTPKIFGCVSFVHVYSLNRGKLDLRTIRCIFVGYLSTRKGYKCYHPPSKKIFVSTNVTFNESESYFATPYLQGGYFHQGRQGSGFLSH